MWWRTRGSRALHSIDPDSLATTKSVDNAALAMEIANQITNILKNVAEEKVCASLLLYHKILDKIEASDYDNFTRRAYVSKAKKIMALPVTYARSFVRPSRTLSTLVNS